MLLLILLFTLISIYFKILYRSVFNKKNSEHILNVIALICAFLISFHLFIRIKESEGKDTLQQFTVT